MTEPPKLLIYNRDAPLRQAYADYLTRHGLLTHSCGSLAELFRLLLWYPYEALLVDLDTALQYPLPLLSVVQRYLPETTVIGTSNRMPLEAATLANQLHVTWFLLEPLTPKRVLEMISIIGDRRCTSTEKSMQLQLRQRLARTTLV